ncbi:MAG: NAD(P)H-quinone oxidoreductase [Saprospiraceae bacterium]
MKAILQNNFGSVEELYLGEATMPTITEDEVLVKVRATALNRADLLQRKGLYPPPPGESEIIGLEMSGEVSAIGAKVEEWEVGDRVFALLAGGGYAEYVKVHKRMLMKIPGSMGFEEAAAVAEAFLTAWQALVWLAGIQTGETILIHAGASGVGTAAIQIAKAKGAKIVVTASKGKHELCKNLGADHCIDYRAKNFAEEIFHFNKRGADVLIDFMGASYFENNIKALAMDGRMVMLGFLGGTKIESLDMGPVLFKRLKIMGSTLRARSLEYKARLTNDFVKHGLSLLATGVIKPVIDSVFDWRDVKQAHTYMEGNKNKGKVILRIGE